MNKKFLILALLLAAALALVGCTQKAAEPTATPIPAATSTATPVAEATPTASPAAAAVTTAETSTAPIELTVEELAKFNGQDGQPAYIAVDGIIYDVTNVGPWKNGQHNGYEAGKELTVEIKTKSPHGLSKLSEVNVVEIGKLITK